MGCAVRPRRVCAASVILGAKVQCSCSLEGSAAGPLPPRLRSLARLVALALTPLALLGLVAAGYAAALAYVRAFKGDRRAWRDEVRVLASGAAPPPFPASERLRAQPKTTQQPTAPSARRRAGRTPRRTARTGSSPRCSGSGS